MIHPTRELNPFEIKAELLRIISAFSKSQNGDFSQTDLSVLDGQPNKKIIEKLLFKELINIKTGSEKIIRFLLERYVEKEDLITQLWAILKNNMASSEVKIIVLSFLRDLETDWKYEDYSEYTEDLDIIDEDTKQLLDKAIVNPEVQIDFLDFLNAVDTKDKILLVKSLADDYTEDALANILVPVFLSQPDSEIGKEALSILGNSRSQLAYHALNTAYSFADEELKPLIKKNLSILKLSGIREDNSQEFYKNLLSASKPYRCCITYPDGHGNQALIFSRTNKEDKKVQFAAIVMNDYNGIRDCFGFNEISQFECDKIIERFYKGEQSLCISAGALKTILLQAEKISKKKANNWLLPYEYVCWKNLLADIDYADEDFIKVLSNKYNKKELSVNEFEKILNIDFMERWFLDSEYSSEFEEFLNILNTNLKSDIDAVDFDELINKQIYTVFYDEEKHIWRERLLNCAYLKMLDKKDEEAELLYRLYFSDEYVKELYLNIIRKSIYEYYFSLKFNTEENQDKFTLSELNLIIDKIEEKWVKNV